MLNVVWLLRSWQATRLTNFADERYTAALTLKDGLYYKNNAVVVPNVRSIKIRILKGLHDATDAGHVGIHRTIKNVQRLYWWPAMSKEIAALAGCEVCQRNKGSQRQPAGKLVPLPLPEGAWDVVASPTCLRRSRDILRSGLWLIG